jgi:hypothetical protein
LGGWLGPDGTIFDRPGYDPDTGLLLEAAASLPAIPEHPSKAQAIAARDQLLEVVADFPFERDVHRAAWLAALLTPLARFAFAGPAPLFLVDANVRAAGKGLLLDCISRIVTGERFTIATYTSDEDELRKRITTLVLAGAGWCCSTTSKASSATPSSTPRRPAPPGRTAFWVPTAWPRRRCT